jgi:hypothetical protein
MILAEAFTWLDVAALTIIAIAGGFYFGVLWTGKWPWQK